MLDVDDGRSTRSTGPFARRRRIRLLLLLTSLLLAGGALRLWYASAQLHINRFEDERYSLQNVRKIYHTGDFEPASGYYPSPVFNLPQVWALRATELVARWKNDTSLLPVGENGRLLPAGFFVTRLYQVFCGTLTLLLVFLAGRRLFDQRVGLLAALSVAFLPWFLHSSGYNKPDALLVMGVCLAFWTSLRAVDSGRLGDHLLAGASIAVAMSAKLTGGLIAVPLTVATLFFLRGDERLRRAALLVAAGLTSALVFIALNPYWKAYLHFIHGLQRDYAGRTDASRLEIPLRVAQMHVSELLFGPLLGTAALVAFVLLLALAARRMLAGEDRSESHRLAMFLVYPLVYMLAYAAQTSYFKANNFLPVVPFTAIALAWLLDALWRSVEGRYPAASKALGWLAATLFALFLFLPGYRYVERSVVPTTFDAARLWLHNGLEPPAARLVYREAWAAPELEWEGTRQLHGGLSAEVEVAEIDIDEMRDADAVMLRLDRPGRGQVESRLRELGFSEILRPEPGWSKLRGPPLLAATRPWRLLAKGGAELESCGGNCFRTVFEEISGDEPGDLAAAPASSETETPSKDAPADAPAEEKLVVFLWLPTSMAPPPDAPRLLVRGADGEQSLPLHFASRKGNGHLFVSPRFDAAGTRELRFLAEEDYGPGLEATQVEIHRWRLAAAAQLANDRRH